MPISIQEFWTKNVKIEMHLFSAYTNHYNLKTQQNQPEISTKTTLPFNGQQKTEFAQHFLLRFWFENEENVTLVSLFLYLILFGHIFGVFKEDIKGGLILI